MSLKAQGGQKFSCAKGCMKKCLIRQTLPMLQKQRAKLYPPLQYHLLWGSPLQSICVLHSHASGASTGDRSVYTVVKSGYETIHQTRNWSDHTGDASGPAGSVSWLTQ